MGRQPCYDTITAVDEHYNKILIRWFQIVKVIKQNCQSYQANKAAWPLLGEQITELSDDSIEDVCFSMNLQLSSLKVAIFLDLMQKKCETR
jgi:hypothetical protein